MNELEEFKALGLSSETLDAIREKGFESPSPIQILTIPVLLANEHDIIAQAQTGTGKTAAFGLPILEKIKPGKAGKVQALILVPTRELALQVTEELMSFNRKKLSISPIYGGAAISEQLRRLNKGVDIVVGTPGRIQDHLRRGSLDISAIKWLVLDEADEMLNMGFIDDVEVIMSHCHEDNRVLLFSATMPDRIAALSKKYMKDVEILKVENKQLTTELTDQIYFEVREADKFDALTRIIDVESDFYGIVFSRTKVGVDELVNKLLERGYSAEGLHGDVSQAQREKILRKFKRKHANILVATDVAARGIDINNLTHVINYSLPQDSESYVHRIGRTGRAGHHGTAITFISSSELRQFGFLKRDVKTEIRREALPTAQDVISIKKTKIKEELGEIIGNELYNEYEEMSREILDSYDPKVALSALLKLAFKNDLEESNYPEIRSINVDRRGTARIFIAIGKNDGLTPRSLVDKLEKECKVPGHKIDDVRILDTFSFVTVPYADAETITKHLNKDNKSSRPIAEIAKPETRDGKKEGRKDGFKSRDGGRSGGRSGKDFPKKDRDRDRGAKDFGRNKESRRDKRDFKGRKR